MALGRVTVVPMSPPTGGFLVPDPLPAAITSGSLVEGDVVLGLIALAIAIGIGTVGGLIGYRRRRVDAEPIRRNEAASTAPGLEPIDVAGSGAIDDEARITALLREHDGRMHQSTIVDETGWSKSKVSMVLSEMEDDGEIAKLRLGRENLISLPGHEPDAVGSPLEE